jgi:hypothetical protein
MEDLEIQDEHDEHAAGHDEQEEHVEFEYEHPEYFDVQDGSDAPRKLELVAFLGDHRIVGTAHFGTNGSALSPRSSDCIRNFNDDLLTLSNVCIWRTSTGQFVERAPFVLLNMDKVDFIYACDESPRRKPDGGS